MENNCTLCKYAKPDQVLDQQRKPVIGEYQYQCLRFPPSAFVIPGQNGLAVGSAFPVVTMDQVCSLYESRDPDALKPPPLKIA